MLSKDKAVYIHIPFCKNICSYCDFCKFYYQEKWINDYLKELSLEIKDRYMDENIKSIYIGGGTPSSLSDKEIKSLLKITKLFKLNKDFEFTFECNLNDISETLIDILKENKVNRISIGIQSFNKKNLEFLGRKADFKDALNKINLIKSKGINNINVDLMYALPLENKRMLKRDLRLFKKLNINHISTYSLIISPHTKISKIEPISEDVDYKMYKIICRYLKKYGFNHYEISNFAKKGFESKHNLNYWNNEEYYGFGVGASGYIDKIRYDNTKNLNEYLSGVNNIKNEILTDKDVMDYEVILGLRKTHGINIKEFYEKYGHNIQTLYPIEKLLEDGLLEKNNGYIFIPRKKLYLMNEILVKLI